MYLPVVLTVLGLWSVTGEKNDFTINGVELKALPSIELRNGDRLELQCVMLVAKTTDFTLNSTFIFYMGEDQIKTSHSINDQASYVIPKVRVSHTGQYKCEVQVGNKKQQSEEIGIRVTGLAPPVLNVSKDEVSEGDEVTVRCEAPGEWAYKKFTFYKVNQKKDEKKTKQTDENYGEVKFLIKEGEEILRFKCDVKMFIIDETSQASAMKTVTVVAPFSVPRIEVLPSLNFTEGVNMSVKCSFQEGRKRSDDIKLILQKNGHIISSSTTNTLSYYQVATVEESGNYTCKVESQTTSKINNTRIDVAELFPKPRLTLERFGRTPYINEGDEITLRCWVDGLAPEDSNRLEYKFILNGGKRSSTRRGGRFTIAADVRFSGSYVCQVTRDNITKISAPLDVQIYAPVKNPVLTHIMRSNKTVVLGDTLELTCKCESGTPPITYSLLRGDKLLDNKTMEGDMEARFLVNSSKSHDLGQYRCRATNRNTKSSGKYSNTVNVTVIVPVSAVQLTMIPPDGDVEEGAQLALVCRAQDGTLPITFQFYRRRGNELLLHNVSEAAARHASHTVQLFSKQEDGAYFCAASNRAHKEVRSSSSEARAVLATWKKAVIGIFVILVILAAIAICIYLHTDKKKKKGTDISSEKKRSSKPSPPKKASVELKAGEPYMGGADNEDELHILKAAEDTSGNNQHNHEVQQTEADHPGPEAHPDAMEDKVNREDPPEGNNYV
ncbi:platelet endothelial cell adhesion molecule isoform X2 [Engystomops pustulosus]|uniref:platelet endothelial cell adhesion molecule isoform X2 n=1 Tax=Engystomops pustulosus TaxID=76066 RepID=UPI003AFA2FA3